MKKYLVLTSIFALAACGGGGGHSGSGSVGVPGELAGRVSDAALASNGNIKVGNNNVVTWQL